MGDTFAIEHDWTLAQLQRATELWRRLLDVYQVNAYENVGYYGGQRYLPCGDVTDEWLTALILSDGQPVQVCSPVGAYWSSVELSLISYSDTGGSDLDAANVRALVDVEGITTSTGAAFSGGSATMTLGEMPYADGDTDEALKILEYAVGLIEGLQDYPLINDEIHDKYLDELAEEAWDAWLSSDVRAELEGQLGNDDAAYDAVQEADESKIREAFYSYAPPDGETWRAESATSVIHVHREDAMRHVLVRVFGQDVENDCTRCEHGEH